MGERAGAPGPGPRGGGEGRGVREAWARYAPRFEAEGPGAEERASLRVLVDLCRLPAGSVVCDVGAGAGFAAFALARAGCRPVAVDPTHAMLLAARRGWADRSLPARPALIEAWAEALPLGDGVLDAVVAHRATHHFADVEAFVLEARRVLRAGGLLAVGDQAPPDGWEAWHNELERTRDPTHRRALSRSQWRELVACGGLRWERDVTVFHAQDVEAWLDRVGCPEPRRRAVRRALEHLPEPLREVYQPQVQGGRLVVRVPQLVFVARRP